MDVCRHLERFFFEVQVKESVFAVFIQSWELIPDTRLWLIVFALFVSKGADCNTTTFSMVYSGPYDVMILEESILSYLDRMVSRDYQGGFKDICLDLRRLNAAKRAQFRMAGTVNDRNDIDRNGTNLAKPTQTTC